MSSPDAQKHRIVVLCSGVVQGIGFRPFVYRIAVKRGLTGYVLNLGDAGVKIVAEGDKKSIKSFLRALQDEKPPLAYYEKLEVKWEEYKGEFSSFVVAKSNKNARSGGASYIPPDIALCDDCRRELFNPQSRRYMYPFIVCSACGPRYTIIEDLPYDRENTTMRDFPMCEDCEKEYTNPLDRRYHAEPTCCPKCGPSMSLYTRDGELIETLNPIKEAAKLLEEGYILAIKGIGGTHVATKTTEDDPVILLRKRRRRPQRPFALMSRDLDAIQKFAEITPLERDLLLSYRRPIVVLEKKDPFPLSKYLAPGLHTIGVMLPYSGIHEILLYHSKEPALVMTSGNYPGQPMAISNEEAFSQLSKIVDYFLLHNRRIINRNDDSVIRIVDNKLSFLRRSRGYVPEPFKLRFLEDNQETVIGFGAEENVTFTLLRGRYAYPSQHIGDVDNLEMIEFIQTTVRNLSRITNINPENVTAVGSDLHPGFFTTKFAEEFAKQHDISHYKIQHHHAHIIALMAEHNFPIDEEVIGIAIDGYGYGIDRTAWGGEILLATYTDFKRLGHLEQVPMPGGDKSTYYPIRMATGILSKQLSTQELRNILASYKDAFQFGEKEIDIVIKQISSKFNTPMTSSTGRVLDAISVLLNICNRRTYEGEPAMKLEAFAAQGNPDKLPFNITISKRNGNYIFNTSEIVLQVVDYLKNNEKPKDIAASAQKAIALGLSELALAGALDTGVNKILLSGGVGYNNAIVKTIREKVESHGLKFYRHEKLPTGDGGISFGQAVAVRILNNL